MSSAVAAGQELVEDPRVSTSREFAQTGTRRRRVGGGGRSSGRSTRGGLFPAHAAEHTLTEDLRDFVRQHPEGWGHQEWLALLDHLRERAHDVSDPDRIGRLLERERLSARLERVRGVGTQRIRALVDHYQTLWNLQQAEAEDLVRVAGIPPSVAKRIKETV